MPSPTSPITREAAASDSCDGLMSRSDKRTLETTHAYHTPLAPVKPACAAMTAQAHEMQRPAPKL